MIKLGQEVKDRVTGFTGIVVARTVWLNGCVRYEIQGSVDKDGKVTEPQSIDEEILVETKKKNQFSVGTPSGGPCPSPKRAPNPKR